MISVWWLFLIIPVSAIIGYIGAAMSFVSSIAQEWENDSDKSEHF